MSTTRKPEEIQASMKEQRKSVRKKQREIAGSHPLMVEAVLKDRLYGVNERGRRVDLKVDINGWETALGFRKELIKEMGPDFREGERIPRKTVHSSMDIYRAVRCLKHIRQSHSAELARNERLFRSIDRLHAMLYAEGSKLDENALREIQTAVTAHIEEVSKKTSSYKLLARWKLDKVPKMLDEALAEQGEFEKRNRISVACTCLTAFKERYGKWRERQMLGIDRYDRAREDGLRRIRDRRLWEFLKDIAGKLEGKDGIGVAHTLASDWKVIQNTRKAQRCLCKGEFDGALALVQESSKLIKPERLRHSLGQIESFVSSSVENGTNGWRLEARNRLEHFARYLGQRNTRYIILELGKTGDKHTEGVAAGMETGNGWIQKALKEERIWMKRKLIRMAASAYRGAAAALAAAVNA